MRAVIVSLAILRMPSSTIQSTSAMSAPNPKYNKCFIVNYLDVAKGLGCECVRHTLGWVQTRFPVWNSSAKAQKSCSLTRGIWTSSPVSPRGAGTWGRKMRQSNHQNLVWFRTRPGGLGVGLSCYPRLLRDLARLDPFPFFC